MQDDLNQSFGFVIQDAVRLLRKNFDRRAESIGVTRSQWFVLMHLWRQDGMRQTDLADLLEVEPISVARMLDRLERDDWVERRNDPADRRTKRIFLTAKVKPFLERLRLLGLETQETALAGISREDQQRFMETLLRIRANVAELPSATEKTKK